MKFNRIYRLRIILEDEEIVIGLPFTLEFNIIRTAMASQNTANFTIYNLAEQTRRRIFKDRFRYANNGANRRRVIFEAGYGDTLTRIFVGDIFQAYSRLEGTEYKTYINCRTGFNAVAQARISKTFSAGITLHELYREIVGTMDNLDVGAIGGENPTFNRPVAVEGNAYDALKTYSRNKVYIDNDLVSVLNFNEITDAPVVVLNPATGLLETPVREEAYLTVQTLFEPQPTMSGIVDLQSVTAPVYNGQYKVIGASHAGVISEAISGQLTSTFNLTNGTAQTGEYVVVGTG